MIKTQRIKEGSVVLCRLFNKPEGKFYGDYFKGSVVSINKELDSWVVMRGDGTTISLHRKEIKHILAEEVLK